MPGKLLNIAPSRTPFAQSDASVLLDLLRGIAGLLVFASHTRVFFFLDFPLLGPHRNRMIVPYLITGAGHQAVVVFFVLSGFFISRSIFQAVARDRWSWKDYLLRRLLRLWLVLLPALLLCLFWDKLGAHLNPAVYRGDPLSPATWFGNFFFLQNVLVPSFGTDFPLWSISNEFWYYMLFPLGFLAIRSSTRPAARLLYILLFAAAATLVHGTILLLFPVWLAGTLLAAVPPPRLSARAARRWLNFLTPLYLLCFFGASKLRNMPDVVGDYLLTLATFGFLWVILAATDPARPKAVGVRLSRGFASFSYSLYAVHNPVLVFALAATAYGGQKAPTLERVVLVLTLCGAILVYAYAIARLTEFHTDKVRKTIEQRLRLPPLSARL